jgi:DNA-directed RNA polymerase subunit M/transcription elongation factor TFIIS
MEPNATGRDCPKCSSTDYVFRGRKKLPPEPGQANGPVETKYTCRKCGHTWKDRTPGMAAG